MTYPKFCYTRDFQLANKSKATKAQAAVAYRSKYWDKGYNLKIFFMGGSNSQVHNMTSIINEMLEPLSLTFSIVLNQELSDIRISFMEGRGSYSYLGTDALFIGKDKETLNIGWSGDDVMYHEFGHALGLVHEHQNPKEGIKWNEQAVIDDLSGPPNNWSIDQIRRNVLDKVKLEDVDATGFDPKSVMLYYFPNEWTIGNFQTNNNKVPSPTDKDFLLSKYAYVYTDWTAPDLTLIGDQNIVLAKGKKYVEQGAKAWDNVDGDVTENIIITGEVNSQKEGTYHILYEVSDKTGNTAEKIRNILVEDQGVPEDTKGGCLSFVTNIFKKK